MRIICVFILISRLAIAQDAKAVMEPVDRLFEGMKKGDSAMVRTAFTTNPSLNTVTVDSKTNQPVIRDEKLVQFLNVIGTPHADVWNEVIWSPKIEVDGNFAQVWAPYAFYINKTFNHCGVDAFHLFKDPSGQWKIFHLADTRTKVGCNVPKEVADRFK